MNQSVIIAESSPAVAAVIKSAFVDNGYCVEGIYTDGIGAMRAAKKTLPSIVTLDLILPRLSGLQLAAALGKLSSPPLVIAISAVTARIRLAQAKQAGVRYYILKPIANEKLREVISRELATTAGAVG